MAEEKPINRRSFFRDGFRELLKPLAGALDPIVDAAAQFASLDATMGSAPAVRPPAPIDIVLRPPGALPERDFLNTCSRCGECVRVCPAQCIKIESTKGSGVPLIIADDMPCVVCDGLLCMHNCPSGALVPTALGDIDMGTAKWNAGLCLRTKGEDCTLCIDHCPLGTVAITLRNGNVHVIEDGCTGCGVCQHDCPTDPKSIFVIPKSARRQTI